MLVARGPGAAARLPRAESQNRGALRELALFSRTSILTHLYSGPPPLCLSEQRGVPPARTRSSPYCSRHACMLASLCCGDGNACAHLGSCLLRCERKPGRCTATRLPCSTARRKARHQECGIVAAYEHCRAPIGLTPETSPAHFCLSLHSVARQQF